MVVIPRPGPVGTFMAPFLSRSGGSYQVPVLSRPPLYSWKSPMLGVHEAK